MDESLQALNTPGPELASLTADLVQTLRFLGRQPEMPDHRRVRAMLETIDELFAAPGPGDGAWEGYIPPGTTPERAAIILADLLNTHPYPVTLIAQRWAGDTVMVKTDRIVSGAPAEGERRRLRYPAGTDTRFWTRTGWMVGEGSGVVVAATRLTLAVDEARGADEEVMGWFGSELPFGALCGDRLARRARAAWPYPGRDPAVDSTALLALDGRNMPCGAVRELFTAEFMRHAVMRASVRAGAADISAEWSQAGLPDAAPPDCRAGRDT